MMILEAIIYRNEGRSTTREVDAVSRWTPVLTFFVGELPAGSQVFALFTETGPWQKTPARAASAKDAPAPHHSLRRVI